MMTARQAEILRLHRAGELVVNDEILAELAELKTNMQAAATLHICTMQHQFEFALTKIRKDGYILSADRTFLEDMCDSAEQVIEAAKRARDRDTIEEAHKHALIAVFQLNRELTLYLQAPEPGTSYETNRDSTDPPGSPASDPSPDAPCTSSQNRRNKKKKK